MKLAKVEHIRCGEPEWGYATYVWVADDMTEDGFAGLVQSAQQSYLDAEKAIKEEAPENPGYSPNYRDYPDLTVAEVDAAFKARRITWDAYEQQVRNARKPFSYHLVLVGKGRITGFYDDPAVAFTAEADWGHRHGTVIEYGGTKINDLRREDRDEREAAE